MSGTSTPSRKLSSTTTRVAPPSRRNAFSCNSAQMRELERNVRKRAALRLQPQHHHEQSGASIFSCLRITDHGARAVVHLTLFPWSRKNHRAWPRATNAPRHYLQVRERVRLWLSNRQGLLESAKHSPWKLRISMTGR